ncbi:MULTISPECIES: FadR/GntR family transcriptional regulator [Shewanella]|uniref:FadR/GntR family transcriptional regulator n=1 Tax=Shewanella TaxID=22 RepID=UPI00167A4DD8|nr:FadR/GntR family transcriptional regulator [Shewanella fodinae]MCL2906743.1 FadR family transcriptional regulator [Shewanella fodinae]GGZ02735.1 GntR family transcriptional regulator [Shewanella fodinae]
MENFKPLKQIKASDAVAQQLRAAIFDGTYRAGDKLPSERELIESFQVSRTVVREAIKGLEASGLVQIKQGATGGAFVKLLTFERLSGVCRDLFFVGRLSFKEICEARLIVEPQIARMAALNCDEMYSKALSDADLHESDTLEYPETVVLRQKVHCLLADMCGNRFLAAISKSLLQLVGEINEVLDTDTDLIHPIGLHKEIVDAVIANDQDKAEQAMRNHLTEFLGILQKIEQDFRENERTLI